MMENIYWKKTVDTMIGSVWIFMVAGIGWSILMGLEAVLTPQRELLGSMLQDSDLDDIDLLEVCRWFASVLSIVGYYLFFKASFYFSLQQRNEEDRKNMGGIHKSYLFMVVAVVMAYVPLVGWFCSFLLMAAAYIKQKGCYRRLGRSIALPYGAVTAARHLKKVTEWMLAVVLIRYIPTVSCLYLALFTDLVPLLVFESVLLAGSLLDAAVSLALLPRLLRSWQEFRDSAPLLTEEEQQMLMRKLCVYRE